MKKRTYSLKNRKVELRPCPASLKIVLILLIVSCTAALAALRWVHNGIQAEIEGLRNTAAVVEYANRELERKKDSLGSVQSIEEIAKEELGMVDPDTVMITPNN